MRVTFHGVRGSTPCSGEEHRRYGGNTSCVVVEYQDEAPIIFDLGTGLREYGHRLAQSGQLCMQATVLLTHLHWDHVQGLPFFSPLHCDGTVLDVYGPLHDEAELGGLFCQLMKPPYFPIDPSGLVGAVHFHDVDGDDLELGTAKVRCRPVPHTGETNGYRVDWGGSSVAYISDHQQPLDDPTYVADEVLELCDNVDLLIHDAQFTPEEFRERPHWGHCTVDYAIEVARQSRARQLALFHHDPFHDDDMIDRLLEGALAATADDHGLEVVAAAEGLELTLGPT